MRDLLLILAAPESSARLAVCIATELAREAAARHQLGAGSAAALGQALAGSLLVAATEPVAATRVDLQLECGGPLKGLLADAEGGGAVRGLVRVRDLDRGGRQQPSDDSGPLARFDPRPVLSTGLDETAGALSILRAPPEARSPQRAAFPFAGADLGAALTLFLRADRPRGGEAALEVLHGAGEPLASVGGALLSSLEDEARTRPFGKPLRQGKLLEALLAANGSAHALARQLAESLDLGPLRLEAELHPRFQCRCSRERVVRALATLGAAELRDMADRDGGASAACDFCAASYVIPADELRALASRA